MQLADYSLAISHLYEEQPLALVTRTSHLIAHPERSKPVTVVSSKGNLLLDYQQKWLDLLGEWYEVYGDQVADEQVIFDKRLELSV